MTATSRTHRIGAFVARIEYPMNGVALIGLATCAYRDGSILMGAICVLLLAGLLLKQAYPRPPDNDDMVMWGVYHERWRFMDAAFRDRHDAEQWVIEHSVGKLGQFGGMEPGR